MQALKIYKGMVAGPGYIVIPKRVCIVIIIAITVPFRRGFAQWISQGLTKSSCVGPGDGTRPHSNQR